MSGLSSFLEAYPTVLSLAQAVLRHWPDHESTLIVGFKKHSPAKLAYLEKTAILAKKIIGANLDKFAKDYIWTCERFKEEQLYFNRHKEYRLKTIEEAKAKVYDDEDYMSRYMNGVLMSQFLWSNHASAFYFYKTSFIDKNPVNYSHVDIGSGHGMFLALTALDEKHGQLEAWDISYTSLEATRKSLKDMNITEPIQVREQDILDKSNIENEYDSVVCSEVLEHTEDPRTGLEHILQILKPGGRTMINVPINSPAPDHLFLWRSSEEVADLFKSVGFEIEEFEQYPLTGASLERAKKFDLNINVVATLKKPI